MGNICIKYRPADTVPVFNLLYLQSSPSTPPGTGAGPGQLQLPGQTRDRTAERAASVPCPVPAPSSRFAPCPAPGQRGRLENAGLCPPALPSCPGHPQGAAELLLGSGLGHGKNSVPSWQGHRDLQCHPHLCAQGAGGRHGVTAASPATPRPRWGTAPRFGARAPLL